MSGPPSGRWRRRAPLVFALLAGAGCSTLAPKPPEVECTGTDPNECGPGFACDNGLCRDASNRPPLAYIGLDLQEVAGGQVQFRTEIAGCDQEVLSEGAPIQVLSLPRREVARRMFLGVFQQSSAPLAATFTLEQRSRFSRDDLRRQVTYEVAEETDPDTIELAWPRYFIDNNLPDHLEDGGFLVWRIEPLPQDDAPAAASRYQLLQPPPSLGEGGPNCVQDLDCCDVGETCNEDDVRNACVTSLGECRTPFDDPVTYRSPYANDCDRALTGRVMTVNSQLEQLGPLPGASVTIRHADSPRADPFGLPRLDELPIADRDAECDANGDCAQGLQCNVDTEQCELPLAGLPAWTGTVPAASEEGMEGVFEARVFTYCEDNPGSGVTRSYDVSVTPPEQLGLPSITLRASVVFDPIQGGGQKPDSAFSADMCVPALGVSNTLFLALSGEPRALLPDYTCCDIDCLPRTAEDAESEPPEARTQCGGASSGSAPSFRVETPLVLTEEQLEQWNAEDSPCVPVEADPGGTVGVLRRFGACDTIDDTGTERPQCELSLPSAEDGSARAYSLRIETPTGSVSGSLDTTLEVEAAGLTVSEVKLRDRILVRGRVAVPSALCDPADQAEGDCGSPAAQVLAERLRMQGETATNTPGPYYHQVSTFYDPSAEAGQRAGAYILPLDPGVWVLTALPDSGTPGGPAALSILDLRTGEAEVDDLDFVLDEGILVTINVASFDRRSQVIPLDTGSWLLPGDAQLLHPDRVDTADPLVDLGAPGECLSADGANDTGCRIRRLIGGSSLPPTQIGQVRFTARDLGSQAAVDCR